jgi:hypothetical protein
MLPMMSRLEGKFRGRDVVFLAVHTAGTEMEQIRQFQQRNGYQFLTAVDLGDDVVEGAASNKYGVRGYPTIFVIRRDGRIAWCNNLTPPADREREMQRAAQSLSLPWPLNEKQTQEQLTAQMNRIREVIFGRAIEQALATP